MLCFDNDFFVFCYYFCDLFFCILVLGVRFLDDEVSVELDGNVIGEFVVDVVVIRDKIFDDLFVFFDVFEEEQFVEFGYYLFQIKGVDVELVYFLVYDEDVWVLVIFKGLVCEKCVGDIVNNGIDIRVLGIDLFFCLEVIMYDF